MPVCSLTELPGETQLMPPKAVLNGRLGLRSIHHQLMSKIWSTYNKGDGRPSFHPVLLQQLLTELVSHLVSQSVLRSATTAASRKASRNFSSSPDVVL